MKRLVAIFVAANSVFLAAPAASELPFEVATIEPQQLSRESVLDGVVEAVHSSTISAQIAGEVIDVMYDVDDYVEQGAVVLRIKAKSQAANTRQAQAGVTEAKARLDQAQQEFERISSIYERRLIARSQLDQATAELNSAKARYSSARAGLAQAKEGLGNAQVIAPYGGIVTQRHVEVGEFVNVGQPLMTGISLQALRVSVAVPQQMVSTIRNKPQASVLLPSGERQAVDDLTVFPYADAASHTFQVRANLTNATEGLFPGMFVKVAFATGMEELLAVPKRAVAHRSEVDGVYILDAEHNPSFRYVRLGKLMANEHVAVLAGLSAGETIALDPIAAGIYYKNFVQGGQSHE